MLRGLATINYFADDVPAAQAWYTEVLGTEPYFDTSHARAEAQRLPAQLEDYKKLPRPARSNRSTSPNSAGA